MLTLDAFEEAAAKVKEVTQETKLIESPYFSEISRNRVFFKPENMQRTGAYKVRGAYYKISTLTDEERAHGLITASAGNHAQGVAYAALARLGGEGPHAAGHPRGVRGKLRAYPSLEPHRHGRDATAVRRGRKR